METLLDKVIAQQLLDKVVAQAMESFVSEYLKETGLKSSEVELVISSEPGQQVISLRKKEEAGRCAVCGWACEGCRTRKFGESPIASAMETIRAGAQVGLITEEEMRDYPGVSFSSEVVRAA